MAKKLTNNIGLKILAVLVAAVLWFIAVNIKDPMDTKTYNVNVTIKNLDKIENSGKYVEVLDNSDNVKVTVKAPRSELEKLVEKNSIIAEADADDMREDGTIPVVVSARNVNVKSEDMHADKCVSLLVENIRRRQMPITVNVQGEPAEQYMLGGTTTAQNAVMLSGPESWVKKVSYVSVDIDINAAESDVNISLPIHLYDADGKEITDKRISRSIDDVSTTAVIWKMRQVPVEYKYVGVPAEGYRVEGTIEAGTNLINVAGKPGAINAFQKLDVNEALDITDATKKVENVVDLKKQLPEGIVFYNPEDTTKTKVSINIVKIPEESNQEEVTE